MNVSAHSVPSSKLNQVLHNYQLFAMNALGGPAHWNAEMAKLAATAGARYTEAYKAALESLHSGKDIPRSLPFDFKLPARLSIPQKPILIQADSQCEQGETLLEGESVACFDIGGEKRLCLPQLLKTVLSKYSLDVINQACDDLYIYCSRCNPEQLEMFKRSGNLPYTASTCGLITMTDAERLCAALLHSSTEIDHNNRGSVDSERRRINESCIPVYHECFGEGHGYLKSDLYCSQDAKCIECVDCSQLFSPKRFVGHSHNNSETRTCHWGFDRNNWRNYIMCESDKIHDVAERSRLEAAFENLIGRFTSPQVSPSTRKRKSEDEPEDLAKSRRFSDSQMQSPLQLQKAWISSPPLAYSGARLTGWPELDSNVEYMRETSVAQSLVKPKLPTQMSCPPALENPESVIPSSECSRYESHFVPNIAIQQGNDASQTTAADDEMGGCSDDDNQGSKIKQEEIDHNENSPCRRDQNNAQPGLHAHGNSILVKDERETKSAADVYMNVLDNLANMERQYRRVLQSSMASQDERDINEQKYMWCSDSIRTQLAELLTHDFK